ncbi:MAG: hypothetical protein R3F65_33745 [bacterium]
MDAPGGFSDALPLPASSSAGSSADPAARGPLIALELRMPQHGGAADRRAREALRKAGVSEAEAVPWRQ